MTHQLISIAQCADLSGLGTNEIVLGVPPSARHNSLYESYLLHRDRSLEAIADMIVADIRRALDLGAEKLAADLLIVLRWFLSEHPQTLSREADVASLSLRPQATVARRPLPSGKRLGATRSDGESASAGENIIDFQAARRRIGRGVR